MHIQLAIGYRIRRYGWVALLAVLAFAGHTRAAERALRLATPFSDGMVVQHGRAFPVWGWAKAGTEVRVEVGENHWTARAGRDGVWQMDVGPLAAGGPYVMNVVAGEERDELSDVLAGELWLCSGQSNMGATMREVIDADAEVAAADLPQVRMLRVPEAPAELPWARVDAAWVPCTPATAMNFSGTAYYFGRKLHRELKMPIGLVVCAWGGSSVVAWTSREGLEQPEIAGRMPYDVLGWRENIRPTFLFNGMLNPIIPLGVRGVVWYQGETEGDPGQNPFLYRYTFPAMIKDWRRQWARPELPFYFVQLPNIKNHPLWPVVRESQAAALTLPATGMITTIDIGRTDQLHPENKRDFGERLAELVLAREYGRAVAVDSPALKSITRDGTSMRVLLAGADGLRTTDGKSPLAFTIAGTDREFHPADATFDGESIVVRAEKVTDPVAVRYAWATDPKVNVVNVAGLPLTPFRTDDWPVDGQLLDWQALLARQSLAGETSGVSLVGDASSWRWSGSDQEPKLSTGRGGALREHRGRRLQIVTSERPPKNGGPSDTPTLCWTRDLVDGDSKFDPAKGCTVELRVQVVKYTSPLAGVELAVTVPDTTGEYRQYRIAVAPMRLYGFTPNELLVLGANLPNASDPHAYRVAVRPDGVAQVYLDGRPMGTLAGEPVKDPTGSWVSVGKRAIGGGVTATIDSVGIDLNGAFAP